MTPVLQDELEPQTIELVRLSPSTTTMPDAIGRKTLGRTLLDLLPVLAFVALPTIVSAAYAYGLAKPRYVSEGKYVVRTPSADSTGLVASVMGGANVVRSTDDAYVAREYITSRDAMLLLVAKDDLMPAFAKAGRDVWWRFPPLLRGASVEALLDHYLRFVEVTFDHGTGISTLTVQAFAAEDAQRLADALLTHTEAFLNGLNARAQADAVQAALRDVGNAKTAAYAALDAVTAFRNAQETVDPTRASAGIVSAISTLSLELAGTNARLAELTADTPQSPEIAGLRSRATALQSQISQQRRLLGGDASSLAPQIERYERLLLDQQFAEKAFMSALSSLESARLDASRQRIFLERVTTPDRPDKPAYPYRAATVLATFASGFAVWRIAHVLGRDTRGHVRR